MKYARIADKVNAKLVKANEKKNKKIAKRILAYAKRIAQGGNYELATNVTTYGFKSYDLNKNDLNQICYIVKKSRKILDCYVKVNKYNNTVDQIIIQW